MNVPFIIVLAIAFLCAAISFGLIRNLRTFSHLAKTTVGDTVGRQGKRVLVRFRDGRRVITAPAACFDSTTMYVGKRVTVKYLAKSPLPQKWDIRIVGTAGYGQRRIKNQALFFCAVACVFAAVSVPILILL